jgi:plasmid maintenance system killer protein
MLLLPLDRPHLHLLQTYTTRVKTEKRLDGLSETPRGARASLRIFCASVQQETLTTSVNKLYSIRINQVRCTLSRVEATASVRPQRSFLNMTGLSICIYKQDWEWLLLALRSWVFTVGSSSGLLRRWLACRSPRAKCRTTRNSQQSSPSQTRGIEAKMPAPRQRALQTRLQCLKAVAAPKPSTWLGLEGTTKAHYSSCLHHAVVAAVVPGLRSLCHP